MKKIYAQKKMFIFMNFFSIFWFLLSVCGGITIDKSWFYFLFVSLGLLTLSSLFLVNRIYYDENQIKFSLIYKKATVKYTDIKEIFIQYDVIVGAKIIFNLEKKTDGSCYDYLEYDKICKKENIKNTIFILGISKKDSEALLKYCHCDKKGIYF